MSKTSTFNQGRNWAQSGHNMPNTSNWNNATKQTFQNGFNSGKK